MKPSPKVVFLGCAEEEKHELDDTGGGGEAGGGRPTAEAMVAVPAVGEVVRRATCDDSKGGMFVSTFDGPCGGWRCSAAMSMGGSDTRVDEPFCDEGACLAARRHRRLGMFLWRGPVLRVRSWEEGAGNVGHAQPGRRWVRR